MSELSTINCLFCQADLGPLHHELALDEIGVCPRCGAAVVLSTDLAGVRREMAAALLGESSWGTDEQAPRIEVLIRPGVDLPLDAPPDQGAAETGQAHLAVAWDPDEPVSPSRAAAILGVTRERVYQLLAEGAFPNADRAEPVRHRYRRGRWLIPRRDVQARLVRRSAWAVT